MVVQDQLYKGNTVLRIRDVIYVHTKESDLIWSLNLKDEKVEQFWFKKRIEPQREWSYIKTIAVLKVKLWK